jgi:putative Holliday junction resolvase
MKYIAIDYGAKRVGTAASDESGMIAFPRRTLANDGRLLDALASLASSERADVLVVGDTRTHGGAENAVTKEAEIFMNALAERTGKKVIPAFEVFSSVEASRYAPKGVEHNDEAAAAIILQRFLDMHTSQ